MCFLLLIHQYISWWFISFVLIQYINWYFSSFTSFHQCISWYLYLLIPLHRYINRCLSSLFIRISTLADAVCLLSWINLLVEVVFVGTIAFPDKFSAEILLQSLCQSQSLLSVLISPVVDPCIHVIPFHLIASWTKFRSFCI